MDSIILIFICLLAGVALSRIKAVPANGHMALNNFVIYISLPALALYYIPKIEVTTKLLYPLGVAWIGFLFAWLLFGGLGKWLGWSKKLIGCLVLTAGLGNTSFVGFPIIEALYGKKGLETAIITDQPGTFVVMATLGIIVAASYSKGSAGVLEILKKILLFPPFLAFFAGAIMNICDTDFAAIFQPVLQKLGSTVTPVALVAVGMQIKIQRRNRHWGFLSLGLFYKLILMPAILFVLYKIILGQSDQEINVSLMEAAMAPMITAAILASAYGLKPKLAGMMIGVGIPLSFATLAIWYYILNTF
ncbi:AEC family transporter [Flavobacterium sp. NRK1]|uniref:AEC family transporter n=1 Tax=Flavobacterium sp. NRK1 TaxID=2954929 RepID=UPI002091EA2E|nr:AEC family transporter [Flavobacterium sp. NRK1]MCO6146746.1 AEC family transporter [Flavobacterium sp. NRK1]